MSVARFEVFEQRVPSEYEPGEADRQWYWRLVAANNEIVASSEGYESEDRAWRGAWAAHRTALAASDALVVAGKMR